MKMRTGRLGVRLLLAAAGMLIAAGLGGCGTSSAPPESTLNLNPYTIDFTADPAVPSAGAPVSLRIVVNGKTPLTKRAEIFYEVKKNGSEDRTEVQTEAKSDNRFEGTYTFPESGFYDIVVHVTTRTVHQIATHQLEIK